MRQKGFDSSKSIQFHSRLQPQGWIISHHICCQCSSAAKKLPLRIKPLLSVYSFISCSVCLHLRSLKSLVISLPELRREPKGFNALSNHSESSPETVLSFGLCSHWPSAGCCTARTESLCATDTAANLCDAGRRSNCSFHCHKSSSVVTICPFSDPLKLFVIQLLHVFIDIHWGGAIDFLPVGHHLRVCVIDPDRFLCVEINGSHPARSNASQPFQLSRVAQRSHVSEFLPMRVHTHTHTGRHMCALPNAKHTRSHISLKKWRLKAQLLTQTHFHVPAPQIKPTVSHFLVSPLVEQVGDRENNFTHTHTRAHTHTHLFLMIDTIKAPPVSAAAPVRHSILHAWKENKERSPLWL